MRILILPLILLFTSYTLSQDITLKFLPGEKLYRSYYADAIAPQFSLSKHLESSEWFGNIGNDLPVADINIYKLPFQVSLAASAFSTLIKTPGHIQVYTIDYLVEFYGDFAAADKTTVRFIMGHLSAHYADDGITQLGYYPISYVRDYFGLHAQQKINPINGRIYAGINYNFHNEPVDEHFLIQAGFECEKKIAEIISVYAALDLKFKSEVNYGSTQSYQFGFNLKGAGNSGLRLAYTHRRGFEERGQLYDKKDIKNTIGFYFDF